MFLCKTIASFGSSTCYRAFKAASRALLHSCLLATVVVMVVVVACSKKENSTFAAAVTQFVRALRKLNKCMRFIHILLYSVASVLVFAPPR